ncbi:MAG: hypothetical protein LUC98_00950 [Lachnospiraceae bacterium]|nr:hypothetical protein [Lachnospiraceae bacterium]
MKTCLKNMLAVCFLILFLPYTITLLVSGREGIHQDKALSELEYQTLSALLKEDFSWMDDETLALMAVIFRTECMQTENEQVIGGSQGEATEDSDYERFYQAVAETAGQVVTVEGEYRELPWHALSAGQTRDGTLLGEKYSYIKSVECPLDIRADGALQSFRLSEAEFAEALGTDAAPEELETTRDGADYVISASAGAMVWQGEELRGLLHLSSSCFWLDCQDSQIHLTVKGSGHGFGISLYTADCMAREGSTCEEILQTFYEGAECITEP